MAITKVTVQEALKMDNSLLIDVRSPKEYSEDHILEAISLPLLNDEERHEIGIIYKQISREKAIERGIDFYGPKIPGIHAAVKNHRDKNLVVYCARGGMRSGIIASLLDSLGFKVFQVIGGYKAFRNYIVDKLYNFEIKPKVIVLWGLTCSGKTELLHSLPNSLDLENLAQHRGSTLGALGLQPNSQKKFENLLLKKLKQLNHEKVIFVEGESRRIGDVIIPAKIYSKIINGTTVMVEQSMDIRIASAVKDYFQGDNIKQIKDIVNNFKRLMGKKKKIEFNSFIDDKDYNAAVKMLLEDYYDPLYNHTLKSIRYQFTINNDNKETALTELKKIAHKLS